MKLSRKGFLAEESRDGREKVKDPAPGNGMQGAAPGGGPPVAYDPGIARFLEEIYTVCNRIERLELDPLAVVRRYSAPEDIEVAGLVCSTLAFGSVELVVRACETALKPLGARPAETLRGMERRGIERLWGTFQYRFCFPKDMIALMWAIRKTLREYSSLEALFLKGDGASMLEAASAFVKNLRRFAGETTPSGLRKNLLPDPADGSASKRLFLFFRWMVRRDEIDPGCWQSVDPSRLIVPMDTHMARTCAERLHFLPGRRERAASEGPSSGINPRAGHAQAAASSPAPGINLRAALRVTEAFRLYAPDDPVKYDFALTRPGIDPRPGDERFGCL